MLNIYLYHCTSITRKNTVTASGMCFGKAPFSALFHSVSILMGSHSIGYHIGSHKNQCGVFHDVGYQIGSHDVGCPTCSHDVDVILVLMCGSHWFS